MTDREKNELNPDPDLCQKNDLVPDLDRTQKSDRVKDQIPIPIIGVVNNNGRILQPNKS